MADKQAESILRNDFSDGVIRNVSDDKRPISAVPFAVNFDFDVNLGEATIRKGTAMIGSQISDGKAILGLVNLRRRGDTNHRLLAIVNDSSNTNSDIYQYS